jgi:hypothetical protein
MFFNRRGRVSLRQAEKALITANYPPLCTIHVERNRGKTYEVPVAAL